MRRSTMLVSAMVAAGLATAAPSAWAATATIKGTPSVVVEVPDGFKASDTDRGVEIKTPDEEVMVWFETFSPNEQDALVKEHDAYWSDQGVELGAADHSAEESDGHKIVATTYKSATWKGKPTVVRYIFIDGGFASKELILMSMWASPEGFAEHNADLSKIVSSIETKQ